MAEPVHQVPAEELADMLVQPMAAPASDLLVQPTAPASPAPNHPAFGGLLSGLLSGLTNTVGNLTQSVVGTVSVLPTVTVPTTDTPIIALPDLLPDLGTPPEVLPVDESGSRTDVPAPAVATPIPPATPAAATTKHNQHQAVSVASAQRVYGEPGGAGAAAAEHANRSPKPQPVTPAPAPVAPAGGSTVATANDNSNSARGTHGVLSERTSLQQPPAPGFTTRSRAADVSGRISGLPATSPD